MKWSPAEFKGKSNRRCVGKMTPESNRGVANGLQLDITRNTKKLVGKSLCVKTLSSIDEFKQRDTICEKKDTHSCVGDRDKRK
jgi:hypothetical protein